MKKYIYVICALLGSNLFAQEPRGESSVLCEVKIPDIRITLDKEPYGIPVELTISHDLDIQNPDAKLVLPVLSMGESKIVLHVLSVVMVRSPTGKDVAVYYSLSSEVPCLELLVPGETKVRLIMTPLPLVQFEEPGMHEIEIRFSLMDTKGKRHYVKTRGSFNVIVEPPKKSKP